MATAVELLSIGDVRNVNIIKSGQTQPFAESGITVSYGNNGSGKSGYSRIMKLTFQARDKDELILKLVRVPAQCSAHRRCVTSLVDTTRAAFVSLPRRCVPNARAQASLEQLTHPR
jgi:hypothetical protein